MPHHIDASQHSTVLHNKTIINRISKDVFYLPLISVFLTKQLDLPVSKKGRLLIIEVEQQHVGNKGGKK